MTTRKLVSSFPFQDPAELLRVLPDRCVPSEPRQRRRLQPAPALGHGHDVGVLASHGDQLLHQLLHILSRKFEHCIFHSKVLSSSSGNPHIHPLLYMGMVS